MHGGAARLVELAAKHLNLDPRRWLAARGLDADRREQIDTRLAAARQDPAELARLHRELPRFLADDLNAAVRLAVDHAGGPSTRLVLFFDTHDAIWARTGRTWSEHYYFEQDAWLRRFPG